MKRRSEMALFFRFGLWGLRWIGRRRFRLGSYENSVGSLRWRHLSGSRAGGVQSRISRIFILVGERSPVMDDLFCGFGFLLLQAALLLQGAQFGQAIGIDPLQALAHVHQAKQCFFAEAVIFL